LIQGSNRLGFAITKEDYDSREQEYESMRAKVMDALKKAFRPEFINRLDGIMVFRALSRDEIALIADLELRPLRLQLGEQEIRLEVSQEARLAIAEAGYDPDYGARPLRRAIQNRIQDPLSEMLLANKFVAGDTVLVDYREVEQENGKRAKDFVFELLEHREIEKDEPSSGSELSLPNEEVDELAALLQ
jgi:ATP-dependent Clp protease ATP-binding subunit ClpC